MRRWGLSPVVKGSRSAPLILASASPRRRQLLRRMGLTFTVIPSHCPEHSAQTHPRKLVEELALRKARSVAKTRRTGRVLGADTVVVLKNHIIGKPKDSRDAYRMLYRLSGTTHRVYTGVALVDAGSGRQIVRSAVSTVRMIKMDLEKLLKLARKHMDKAGSYAIQEKRDPIARVIRGSYENVVGLPVDLVRQILKQF